MASAKIPTKMPNMKLETYSRDMITFSGSEKDTSFRCAVRSGLPLITGLKPDATYQIYLTKDSAGAVRSGILTGYQRDEEITLSFGEENVWKFSFTAAISKQILRETLAIGTMYHLHFIEAA